MVVATAVLHPFVSALTAVLLSGSGEYDAYAPSYDGLNGDRLAAELGVNRLRERAGLVVGGDVLETCIGTGLHSAFYHWTKISSFRGVDSSAEMLKLAHSRIDRLSGSAQVDKVLLLHDVRSLPFEDSQFDTVIDTFSLCVVDDPLQVLREMRRVTRPEGRVVLLENSRSDIPWIGLFQDVTEPVITPLSKNCKWNTDIPKLAEEAGLKLGKHIAGCPSLLISIRDSISIRICRDAGTWSVCQERQ